MAVSIRESKRAYRQNWKETYPKDDALRSEVANRIVEFILSTADWLRAERIGLYSALPWEIDLRALWKRAPSKCVFPRVQAESSKMSFHVVTQWDQMVAGYAGILEPSNNCPAVSEWKSTDLILVPGFAFDRMGARVGSGKGFYDRFLQGKEVPRWGVCYRAQLFDGPILQERTDLTLNAIITEDGRHLVG